MVSLNACLNEFLQPVPTCAETADVAAALTALSQHRGSDHLVLLNPQGHPTRLLKLQSLLLYSLAQAKPFQPLAAIPSAESLTLLPSNLTLEAALPSLQAQPSHLCAIVNQNGAFLGLLDQAKLVRVLLRQVKATDPSSLAALKVEQHSQAGSHQVEQQWMSQAEARVEATDFVPVREAIGRPQRSSRAARDFARLNPLPGLIEHLPLPLMLQTSEGKVLAQNSLWREQVGELLDPGWIRHEAAVLLETPTSFASDEALSFSDQVLTSSNACQRGARPNSCICSCTLKNGQEQVLQFVKIPIGTIARPATRLIRRSGSTHSASTRFSSTRSSSTQEQSDRFRLATLISTLDAIQEPKQEIVPAAPETLWLVLAQDITEQQQLARELTARNADLIQLNRLKDEFLSCISHELRTPLTAILGLASLLKDQTLGALNPRQIYYAQLIYQSGRHLTSVVNDILDLTRIETGQLELAPEPVEIATVCQRAFEQAKQGRSLADSGAIAALPQFSLEIEPGLKLLVADETRLRQMLMHLLSNALKFTDPSQSIGLKVDRWGGWVAFTVWDRGLGIPASKQHLIFQKFQQLENPLTRQFEGTGLGLVLTQRIARLHGGDVTFLSKEGEGSQFTILLPPCPPQKSLASSDDTAPPSTPTAGLHAQEMGGDRSRVVLVVEAAPQFLENLSEQLTNLGYRVVVARSGTEALEKARRLQPCITFLNPVLPQLSGWDVLTLLKSGWETRQIPVVMMSTKVDESQAQHSHADGLIGLPVQLQELQHSLQQWVKAPPSPHHSLTILRLSPVSLATQSASALPSSLNSRLHSHCYQVLEADDLEQADLLVRVWKPIAVLIDRSLENPKAYFQQLSQHPLLAALPLVTLDEKMTQAANQVAGLLVFPCLTRSEVPLPLEETEISALLQAIEV
ncbi:MAG TPA: hybrid sensor histidine kinase/response regulator, partial [Thermosynechococcaceae cyanobacterium]